MSCTLTLPKETLQKNRINGIVGDADGAFRYEDGYFELNTDLVEVEHSFPTTFLRFQNPRHQRLFAKLLKEFDVTYYILDDAGNDEHMVFHSTIVHDITPSTVCLCHWYGLNSALAGHLGGRKD